MKRSNLLATACALALALCCTQTRGSTAYGDLNNFDTINDTGVTCHGFEIEIEDLHSRDITYTYDWNHYGAPRITEVAIDPAHPKVTIRYASAKAPDGSWAAFTAVPSAPLAPTDGHSCTDPGVNLGCEHFGVGYYGAPTVIRYYWLIDDGAGALVRGPSVNIATPSFVYYPPVPNPVAPLGPPLVPAVVQAAIVAPEPAELPTTEFGPATWVKEIRTTTHNANKVALRDLVSDDPNNKNEKNWKNGEPDEVEVEWQLLQTDYNAADGGANAELKAAGEDLPNGDEVVTRRYEFFKYVGPIDLETGEALADNVAPDGIHGVGVKTAGGIDYDLATLEVVGGYIGAQMAGFDAAAPLGLIDHLQDGEKDVAYVERTVVIGGNSPYLAQLKTGVLPAGMNLDTVTGILSGTPTEGGAFTFSIEATDADGILVTREFQLNITSPVQALVIAGVQVSAITPDSATISWTTDQPSTTQLQLDTSLMPVDPNLVLDHTVTVTGLTPSTTYHYVVGSSTSGGVVAVSPDATFTTSALPPPAITDVQVSSITIDSALISWTTDQPSTTQLQVGSTVLPLDPALVVSHAVTVTGLAPATTYHYVVASANSAGSESVSSDATFTTTSLPAPLISDIMITGITLDSATVSWTTDQPSTTQIQIDSTVLPLDPALVVTHAVTLTGLSPATLYAIIVASANSAGTVSTSPGGSFTTEAIPAPVISAIQVTGITPNSATVSWTTDQPSTSQIQLGTTLLPVNPALVTAHSITLTGLTPSTTYHFTVASGNAAGVISASLDSTFTTTAVAPPVLVSGVGRISEIHKGYLVVNHVIVRFTPDTVISFKSKSHEIEEGDWVSYSGTRNKDGSIQAKTLLIKHT